MKRILIIGSLLFVGTMAQSCDRDSAATIDNLPAGARQIMDTYLAGRPVAGVTVERDFPSKTYHVYFTDGDRIEFDRRGDWKELEFKSGSFPSGLVPRQIAAYVEANYPGMEIVDMDRGRREYEITMNNRLELTFDRNYNLIEMDN